MPTVPPRLSSWAAAHGQPPTGEPLRIGRLPSTTSLSTKLSRRRPGAEHREREPNHGGLVRYFLPDSRGILEHTIWYSGHWRQDMQCGFEPLRPASIIPLFRWLCCRRWRAKEGWRRAHRGVLHSEICRRGGGSFVVNCVEKPGVFVWVCGCLEVTSVTCTGHLPVHLSKRMGFCAEPWFMLTPPVKMQWFLTLFSKSWA